MYNAPKCFTSLKWGFYLKISIWYITDYAVSFSKLEFWIVQQWNYVLIILFMYWKTHAQYTLVSYNSWRFTSVNDRKWAFSSPFLTINANCRSRIIVRNLKRFSLYWHSLHFAVVERDGIVQIKDSQTFYNNQWIIIIHTEYEKMYHKFVF